jgi:AcrR family transcriptional regulator
LRRLGDELGVDSTAVYRHFRSKDELLAVAADRVLCGIFDDLELTGSWKDDLRSLFLALRRAYLQHPQALLALQLDPPELENGFANVERCVQLLLRSGLHRDEVPVAYEALETYTIGATLFDVRATEESLQRWRKIFAQLPSERFPSLSEIGGELYRDVDAAFTYGLDRMLDAVEAQALAAIHRDTNSHRRTNRRKTSAKGGT